MDAKRLAPVLIVDDDRTTLRLLRTLLSQMDIHDVEDATDGLDALEKMGARHFGLIVSDWHMQPMNGLDLLIQVRRDPLRAPTPFIMVTAECAPDRVTDAKRAGVSAYILKPFDAKALQTAIRAVVLP